MQTISCPFHWYPAYVYVVIFYLFTNGLAENDSYKHVYYTLQYKHLHTTEIYKAKSISTNAR